MLIENAVKHNIISRKKPLTVKVYSKDDYIVVSNNLQKKDTQKFSTKLGLENIKSRYLLISGCVVKEERGSNYFRIVLPFINRENEGTDH